MNEIIKSSMSSSHNKQKGIALVLILIVLLAMTLLGLAAVDSSNLQSLMARNNQFRMEAFNASNTEIEAQIDFLTATTNSTGISPALTALIRSDEGTVLDSVNDPLLIISRSNAPEFQKELSLTYDVSCTATLSGEQLNTNNRGGTGIDGVAKCYTISIDSDAEYVSPNIGSDQLQKINLFAL